ncbi:MAG: hypothetical protein JRE40_08395 [Deltaproteobacteria bacterium]|nr:hypothetical protein [Deltaproteobacteria bacterium]
MRTRSKLSLHITCVLVLLVSAGCASLHAGNYGRIIPYGDVTGAFETYQIDPDLNYYISGSDVCPNAIMGLSRNYVLNSTLWKRVLMTPQTLDDLVSRMQMEDPHQFGFALFDNKGHRIGVWYSILSAPTVLWMEDDHTVVIVTPDIDTYDSFFKGSPNETDKKP